MVVEVAKITRRMRMERVGKDKKKSFEVGSLGSQDDEDPRQRFRRIWLRAPAHLVSWQWLQLCISPLGPAATIKHRTESGGPVILEVESRLMTSTTKSSEEWTRNSFFGISFLWATYEAEGFGTRHCPASWPGAVQAQGYTS